MYAVDDTYIGTTTNGNSQALIDVTTRGDSTPFSLNPATIVSEIISVFDAPVNQGTLPADATAIEDELSVLSLDSINLDDRDETGSLRLRLHTTSGGQLSWVDDPALTFNSTGASLEISGDAASINNYLSGAVISYLHITPNTFCLLYTSDAADD